MRLLVLTLVGVAVSLPACREGEYCGADPLPREQPVKKVDLVTRAESEDKEDPSSLTSPGLGDEGKMAETLQRQARQCTPPEVPCTGPEQRTCCLY